MATTETPEQQTVSESVAIGCRELLANPQRIIWKTWNWKAAVLSSALRAHLFLAMNLTAGWRAAVGAGLTELLFRFIASGFYGALTQSFRYVQPAWAGALSAALLLPAVSHSVEWLVHWLRGTPNLRASIIASVCFTAISTAFNWYAMRRGVLVVGDGEKSIWADLRQVPGLFVEIGRWAYRGMVQLAGRTGTGL